MRQPGNEFKVDPFKVIATEEIPAPVLSGQILKDHQHWAANTVLARQHKFCANVCLNFKKAGGIQKDEEACLDSCFTKYSQALGYFQQEKNHFMSSLADIALRGEDKYHSRDI